MTYRAINEATYIAAERLRTGEAYRDMQRRVSTLLTSNPDTKDSIHDMLDQLYPIEPKPNLTPESIHLIQTALHPNH